MARISDVTKYPFKASPDNSDYVIGTDHESGETKSFTLGSLLAQTGEIGYFVPKGGYEGTAQGIVDEIPIYTSELINDGSQGLQPYAEQDSLNAIQAQVNSIQGILFSDNVNLDTVQEIVDSIESLQTYLATILVNDLVTGGITKALTAEQGLVLNGLIQDINTELSNKVDKVVGERLINASEITKLANQSGTNTGDQDLSGKVDKVVGKSLILDTEITRLAGVSNVDISGKVDKVAGERLVNAAEIVKLTNTSGTNTGDQDLSGKEDKANKKTTLATTNDTDYPTTKLLADSIANGTVLKSAFVGVTGQQATNTDFLVPFASTGGGYESLFSNSWFTFNPFAKLVKLVNATFSGSVIVPNATLATQAVNKGQLDLKANTADMSQVLTHRVTWNTGNSQVFNIPNPYYAIYAVSLNGQLMAEEEYSFTSTTQVTIIPTLANGDYVRFLYGTNASANNAPYYTQAQVEKQISDKLVNSTLINGVTLTSAIPATGNIHTIIATAGTYTQWNNLVNPANTISVLMRVNGVFSISQTALDISSKINISDITTLNITNKTPLTSGTYYNLTTAISAVPSEIKKTGLKLTFESSEGIWNTWTFTGVLSDWSKQTFWKSSETIYKRTSILKDLSPKVEPSGWLNNGVFTIPANTSLNGAYFGYYLPTTGMKIYFKIVSTVTPGCYLMGDSGNIISTVNWKLRADGKYEYIDYLVVPNPSFILYFYETATYIDAHNFYFEEISVLGFQTIEDAIAINQTEILKIPETVAVIKENIFEGVSKSVYPSSGASNITNGFNIPIGQTGANSYLLLIPTNFKFDSEIRVGQKVKFTATIEISNYAQLTQPLSFTTLLQKFRNGGQLDNLNPIIEYTDTITGVNLTRVVSFSYVFTQDDFDNKNYYRIYLALNNSNAVASTVNLVVSSLTFSKVKFLNDRVSLLETDILNKVVNPIYKIITAKRSGTADFVGRTAIQDAINSITDASEANQYIIKASGVFECTTAADFIVDAGSGFYQLVKGKDFVHLDGIDRDNCVITCSLPDNLGTGFAYQNYQNVWWNVKADINNVTIIGKNLRYPLHIDGGAYGCENFKQNIKNSTIWHQGNTNNAFTVWGIGTAFGLGTSSGQEITVENCILRNPKNGLYAHDNSNFNNPSTVKYINCEVISDNGNSDGNIVLESLGAGLKSKTILENTNITQGSIKFNFENISKTNLLADNANYLLDTDLEPRAIRNYQAIDTALMFKTILTGASASVSFVSSSSAFSALIGDASQTIEYINRYGFKQLKGYSYRNGINALNAFAYGLWNVKENASSGDYLCALGKRLGDCSIVNKTLGIIINGTTYNVVFNKNYNGTAVNIAPNYTNAQIIAEINTIIGSVATCSTFAPSVNYYPKFKGVQTRVNADTTECLSGMGVVFLDNNSFRKALNADGYIDGIILDDCGVGQTSRLITSGEIYSNNFAVRFFIKEISTATRAIGTKAGISATAGVFDVNANPKVLICKQLDIYEIIK